MIWEVLGRTVYEQKPPTRRAGRFAYAPITYAATREELRLLTRQSDGRLQSRKLDIHSFTSSSHPDDHSLDETEENVILKAKKRPVVLLSKESFAELDVVSALIAGISRRLETHSCWLVVPIYTYHHPDLKPLTEALYFPAFFPLLGNKSCPRDDSFARFDRLQVVHETLIEPSNCVLMEGDF
jgi:hypothetical protein